MNEVDLLRAQRWRLVLGKESDSDLGCGLDSEMMRQDKVLEYLYNREYRSGRNVRGKGSLDESQLTIPDWINETHTLFPKRTIERLEKDALERYEIQEMVTNPELLKRVQPNMTLLKAILRTKHLMNKDVLQQARVLVAMVVEELMKKLCRDIENPFYGIRDRNHRSFVKQAKNFDFKQTVKKNLRNFDPDTKKLYLQEPLFNSRIRSLADKWQIIILVDQSGSMVESAIHAAITASIFWTIKSLRTKLIIFDTSVVDLTDDCKDPVETLMKVQLGGGTDIGLALNYVLNNLENPRKTILVLISDFYEGAPVQIMFSAAKSLIESGVTFLGLAALDSQANPTYDHNNAKTLVNLGAEIGAMTPGELAQWVGEKIK